MAKSLSSAVLSALDGNPLAARTFVYVVAKDFDTGSDQAVGFWDDFGNVIATVIDGITGNDAERTFYGSGSIISIGNIPATADISVRSVKERLKLSSHWNLLR